MTKAKPRLLIQGMHGMGDCLHQRAVVRQFLAQGNEVFLETSWPSIYHDLDVGVLRKPVALRTQTKNAVRQANDFDAAPGGYDRTIRVRYNGPQVLSSASKTVLEAMCLSVGADYEAADFRLPVPDEWFNSWRKSSAYSLWMESGKPLAVYRPLVMRTEWRGSGARNADPESYAKLFASIRDTFFVISVADLEPSREWIVGPRFKADVEFHSGELTFETLAALFKEADVIYTSSGFAAILGPAVGTPVINVVGGYEHSGSHNSGQRFVPMIDFGPSPPCECWSSACRGGCNKVLDVSAAIPKLRGWLAALPLDLIASAEPRSWEDMHSPAEGSAWGQSSTPAIPFGLPEGIDAFQGDTPVTNRNHPHHALYLQMTRSSARKNAGPRA